MIFFTHAKCNALGMDLNLLLEKNNWCHFYHVPFPWKGRGQHAVCKTYNPHEPEYNPHEPEDNH